LCAQAAELELGGARVAEVEKADAKKAAEIARLERALEEAECKGALLEGEAASLRQGKQTAEAEVLKTMEETMVLIIQSFNLAVRQTDVLYGGPLPCGQFDQEMEVFNGRLVPAERSRTFSTPTNLPRAKMLKTSA